MREDKGVAIYEVSEYIQFLNDTLFSIADGNRVAIEGEVSSFNVSQGKWVRFDLKDADGLLNCFLTVYGLKTPLEDGMKIRVYGYPKVYPKYGKLSLTVQRIELVGEGALRRAFELMKKRLAEEGLFASERKRPLPRFPQTIGLIASRESAACGDFLRILGNRWGGVRVLLAHVQVQGEPAVRQIVSAFRAMNGLKDRPDVLVLTRGGGSLEDLAAFNSEEVARAVFSSKIPVVVGVGHERDESIADYVADVRASTPTNAAELVAPDRREIAYALASSVSRMTGAIEGETRERRADLSHAVTRLDGHVRRALHRIEAEISRFRGAFRGYAATVASRVRETGRLSFRLTLLAERMHARTRDALAATERLLKTLDPKAVLRRGYAIVRDRAKHVIKDASGVDAGDALTVQLHRGSIDVEVASRSRQSALPL